MRRSVPLGLAGQRSAGSSCQPACPDAGCTRCSCRWQGPLLLARHAVPIAGSLCAPCLGRQSGRSRGVCAQAVVRDHVSSYIAPCYEINGLYSTPECVVQICPHYRWGPGARAQDRRYFAASPETLPALTSCTALARGSWGSCPAVEPCGRGPAGGTLPAQPQLRGANPNLAEIAAATVRQRVGKVPRDFLTAAAAAFVPLGRPASFHPASLVPGSDVWQESCGRNGVLVTHGEKGHE